MLSDNIRTIRKNRGFTQEELAARLHVTRQTISKWEKGYSVPDADQLSRMAEVFEVPVAELLGAPSQPVSDPDPIVEQLSRLNEQLAVRNRRSATIWKIVGIVLAALILLPVLSVVLFGAHGSGSGAEIVNAGNTEWRCTMADGVYFYKVYYDSDYFITGRAEHVYFEENGANLENIYDARALEERLTEWVEARGGTVELWEQVGMTLRDTSPAP